MVAEKVFYVTKTGLTGHVMVHKGLGLQATWILAKYWNHGLVTISGITKDLSHAITANFNTDAA